MPLPAGTRRVIGSLIRTRAKKRALEDMMTSTTSTPTIYHALVVIFLEFFAWGLLTTPVINITHQTFPDRTLLCNGLIQGVKGLLSFLAAPLIGAMSDVLGRKPFLLITVSCTCAPIPFMLLSPWWFFALISLSGAFAVTFTIIFAYVADITTEDDRSAAYGLVSATFAASLITSPAIGAFIEQAYSLHVVVLVATAIACFDVAFILLFIPESLPEKMRPSLPWGSHITWDKADPFGIMGFNEQEVASYIAFVGILSVLAQTVILGLMMKYIGAKPSIIAGLTAEAVQLFMYGFGSSNLIMWLAGIVVSASSISYPAISAFISAQTNPDQQGVAQGVVTGIRGLCLGLGPALFGVVFFLFDVDLNDSLPKSPGVVDLKKKQTTTPEISYLLQNNSQSIMPGPPFVMGGILVLCAILVAVYIPNTTSSGRRSRNNSVNGHVIEMSDKACPVEEKGLLSSEEETHST